MHGTVVAAQCWTDTALTFCCSGGGPRQPRSSGLAPVSSLHSSLTLSPLVPSLTGLLASVDVKQHHSQTNTNTMFPVYRCRPTHLPPINKANAWLYCCTYRFAECSLDEESCDTGEDEGPNSNQAVLHGFGHFEYQQNLALEVRCRLVIYCGRLISADRRKKCHLDCCWQWLAWILMNI